MYLRNGQEVSNSDPAAGLYIRSSSGKVIQARIPVDHLAFQMGEAMQVRNVSEFLPLRAQKSLSRFQKLMHDMTMYSDRPWDGSCLGNNSGQI